MKNLIIGLMLGFLLNTATITYFNYSWWTAEATVTDAEYNLSIDTYGYAKVVQDKMGLSAYLKYPLLTPTYSFREWGVSYP